MNAELGKEGVPSYSQFPTLGSEFLLVEGVSSGSSGSATLPNRVADDGLDDLGGRAGKVLLLVAAGDLIALLRYERVQQGDCGPLLGVGTDMQYLRDGVRECRDRSRDEGALNKGAPIRPGAASRSARLAESLRRTCQLQPARRDCAASSRSSLLCNPLVPMRVSPSRSRNRRHRDARSC